MRFSLSPAATVSSSWSHDLTSRDGGQATGLNEDIGAVPCHGSGNVQFVRLIFLVVKICNYMIYNYIVNEAIGVGALPW